MVREFKYCLYEAVDRPVLFRTLTTLYDMGRHWRRIFSRTTETKAARIEGYRRMLRACEEQDVTAFVAAARGAYALARKTIVAELQREESPLQGMA